MHALRTVRTVATNHALSTKLETQIYTGQNDIIVSTNSDFVQGAVYLVRQPATECEALCEVRRKVPGPDTCFETYPGTDIALNTMFALQVLPFVVHIIFSPLRYPFSSVRAAKPEVQTEP
ncbi:hypothetical protein BELL_0026g00150 [Botrytis elliptica]|uniref:Uncharacterized protein n=1 Tax=Botrytis elliptica TaxID=278938 RepID=A0A4Z1K7X9_9HELO|nr:hypothetical protein BELL_0026g00150 [Botrytis elliptica]